MMGTMTDMATAFNCCLPTPDPDPNADPDPEAITQKLARGNLGSDPGTHPETNAGDDPGADSGTHNVNESDTRTTNTPHTTA